MCGITGVFNLNGESFPLYHLKKMAKAIEHRGPDGEGFYVKDNIAIAHKRLSIIDLTPKGSQPMTSKDGNWIIAFNGCIYNFLELKQELKSLGHEFVSTTDSEVIVEGLSAYGSAFFERLNGMFAVVAWNTVTKKLILSRDRFGVKPLYYFFDGEKIIFGSEIKAIIAHPKFEVEVDLDSLNEYFTFQNQFSYKTLFKGVLMLPPANTISISKTTKEIEHNSWWDFCFSETDESMTFEEAKKETERLFQQAVTRQMIADVPVGSYLSGGMDSGSITAHASKQVNRLSTFTCGFDMSKVTGIESNYDERRDAELMASFFETSHYEQVINSSDLRWSLPRVVYHIEDLRVGMSYPNYYISRLASKFVKVCLQGTGGDELYGGYPWRYYRIFDSINQKDFFEQYYGFWQRLLPDEDKPQLFTKKVIKNIDSLSPRKIFERVFTFNDKLKYDNPEDHIANSLYFEIKTFLPGLLLVGDKLSMANGLEERFPFLDNELVNFAQKIPVKHKLGNLEKEISNIDENVEKKKSVYRKYNDGKNVLRKAMEDIIPKEIINRKKQGFSAPDESWYRVENAKYIKELLLSKNLACGDYINQNYIRKIVDEHINKGVNHRLLIWSFMNFEWWCRIFLNNEKVS
ncbi:MAG: asparagine synthase (glutamine-hydrolyzing) [Crocinitomicaceae bacterium]|nr:asparagine synthase (glutamine-hydrolyzing) [Crocinitomicaceae bacterium]|tara:strand:- start:898 stop:2790 length:1893 start_codon:yes stop_codon:yes gene_type:complete